MEEKVEFGYNLFEQTVSVDSVFQPNEMLDTIAITKGKGTEGVVTRWGVTRLPRKTHRGLRKVSSPPTRPEQSWLDHEGLHQTQAVVLSAYMLQCDTVRLFKQVVKHVWVWHTLLTAVLKQLSNSCITNLCTSHHEIRILAPPNSSYDHKLPTLLCCRLPAFDIVSETSKGAQHGKACLDQAFGCCRSFTIALQ